MNIRQISIIDLELDKIVNIRKASLIILLSILIITRVIRSIPISKSKETFTSRYII